MSAGESPSSTESCESVTDVGSRSAATAVSWGPLEYSRLRSGGVGVWLVLWMLLVLLLLVSPPSEVLGSETLAAYTWPIGAFFIVSGPFLLVAQLVRRDNESTERNQQSLRQRFSEVWADMSWLRPRWVGAGAAPTGLLFWVGDGLAAAVLVGCLLFSIPALALWGRHCYSLDCGTETLEWRVSWNGDSWTVQRGLAWTTGYRRFDLDTISLFVCSNRGKRWYDGPTLFPVPGGRADAVEDALEEVVGSDPPRRVKRDERILFGVIGASMIGVGPFLYFLTSEPALLFILAGPSTLIGLGVVVHALRG